MVECGVPITDECKYKVVLSPEIRGDCNVEIPTRCVEVVLPVVDDPTVKIKMNMAAVKQVREWCRHVLHEDVKPEEIYDACVEGDAGC